MCNFMSADSHPIPRMKRHPRSYWDDESLQKEALQRAGAQLGVKTLDDWYSVSVTQLENLSFINSRYKGSLFKTLQHLYPQHNWDALRFSRVPSGHWTDLTAQRKALEKLGERLGVKELDDWYHVKLSDVTDRLSFMRNYYKSSLYRALKTLYPQHNWDAARFSKKLPGGYWNDRNAQRAALEKIGNQLGVQQLDDWYTVNGAIVHKQLNFIQNHYNGSIHQALKTLYPQHNWDAKKFKTLPRGYWKDESVQREALERYGAEHGVTELDDWYSVNSTAVTTELSFIQSNYNSSLYNALKTLYPEHSWDPLRFQNIPHGYWKKESTAQHYRALFTSWQQQHNITRIEHWYRALPLHQFQVWKYVAKGIFGSVPRMLDAWFPEVVWQSTNTSELELQVTILDYQ
jgi:hypothetical protein